MSHVRITVKSVVDGMLLINFVSTESWWYNSYIRNWRNAITEIRSN